MSEGKDIMGGQETIATLLFSDVRGFTTITETLGAQGTVQLLNEYFDIMVEAISEQGGMVISLSGMPSYGFAYPWQMMTMRTEVLEPA